MRAPIVAPLHQRGIVSGSMFTSMYCSVDKNIPALLSSSASIRNTVISNLLIAHRTYCNTEDK